MDAKLFVLVFQIVSVSCVSSEGLDEDFGALPRMRPYMDDLEALSARDLPGSEPGMEKRQDIGNTQYTASEADAIVERHNHFRSITNPSASYMKHMRWDSDLAGMAQRWADKCIYEHGGYEDTENTSDFPTAGQNLAVGTGSQHRDGVVATNLWHAEEADYTYDAPCQSGKVCGYCTPNKPCGHYTQVVWADSEAVGCGVKLCPEIWVKGQLWRNAYYVVCDYGPGGNYPGQYPFQTGERCSACPNDASSGFCTDNSLCRDCSQVSNKASCGECTRTCENCGTLDSETCTCQCAPGWDGPTCSDVCADHHEWCGRSPGWPGSEYCQNFGTWKDSEQVRENCRKMCGICQAEDSSFVCGGGGGGVFKNTKYCKTTFTATSVIDDNLFTFKKDKYWRFDDIRNGELLTSAGGDFVRDVFPKVNPDVRAVYQRPDNKVAIFRAAKYWLYTKTGSGWTRDNGFPRDISETFPGLSPPSAAVYDSFDGKTYFFSGSKYWKYDETRHQFDKENEPVSRRFDGIPNKITGAFLDHNTDFILVKGKQFWRVRRYEESVVTVEPQDLADEYLDCWE